MNKPIIISLVLILIAVNTSHAVTINDSETVRFKPGLSSGWITLRGNFSNISVSSQYLTLNSTMVLNSSNNVTISNINTSVYDKVNLTVNGTVGTLTTSLKMKNASSRYVYFIDNVHNSTYISNDTGWFTFLFSGAWSQHNLSVRGNALPVIADVTLSPAPLDLTDNITSSINVTDADGDALSYNYRWYINGTLNTTWNNWSVVRSNNLTNNAHVYVLVNSSDGYNYSDTMQSNTLIVGSSNTAPTLPGISLSPSSASYSSTVTVTTTGNVTDNGASVRLLVYYKLEDGTQQYLVNSSWTSPPNNISASFTNPWNDAASHSVFAQAEDLTNLTSVEVAAALTSSVSSTTVVVGSGGGGGGAVPAPTPTPAPAPRTSGINLLSIAQDSIGRTLLQILLLVGGAMVLFGLLSKQAKMSTLVTGMLVAGFSIYALGWVG